MTATTHDPEFPFVFRFSSGDKPAAKFRNKTDADDYADQYHYGQVADTTPAPLPTESGLYRSPGEMGLFFLGEDRWYYTAIGGAWIHSQDVEDVHRRAPLVEINTMNLKDLE